MASREDARQVDTTRENGTATELTGDSIEYRIESLIDDRVEEILERIGELESELEELDNFARISLNERKIQTNEENISAMSESFMGFTERNFRKINELEDRLNTQAMVLSSVLEALDESGIDVDLSAARRMRTRGVVEGSPDERLTAAIMADGTDVEEIDGIGSTYADRLRAAGLRYASQLAAADASEVADAAEVSTDRANTWIDTARD